MNFKDLYSTINESKMFKTFGIEDVLANTYKQNLQKFVRSDLITMRPGQTYKIGAINLDTLLKPIYNHYGIPQNRFNSILELRTGLRKKNSEFASISFNIRRKLYFICYIESIDDTQLDMSHIMHELQHILYLMYGTNIQKRFEYIQQKEYPKYLYYKDPVEIQGMAAEWAYNMLEHVKKMNPQDLISFLKTKNYERRIYRWVIEYTSKQVKQIEKYFKTEVSDYLRKQYYSSTVRNFMRLFNDYVSSFVKHEQFKQKNSIIIESFGLSQYEYKPPEDKTKLLADFYIINTINPDAIESYNIQQFGKGGYLNPTQIKNITQVLKETKETVINYLADDILKAIYYAVCSEMRHTNRSCYNYYELIQSYTNPFYKQSVTYDHAYRKAVKSMLNDEPYPFQVKGVTKAELELLGDNDDYFFATLSYLSSKYAFNSEKDFIKFAQYIFENGDWSKEFGGPQWAKICYGWLQLNDAKSLNDKMVYIDNIINIMHNSNMPALDKVKRYAKDNSHKWLMDFFNRKRDAMKPFVDLYSDASPPMQELLIILNRLSLFK